MGVMTLCKMSTLMALRTAMSLTRGDELSCRRWVIVPMRPGCRTRHRRLGRSSAAFLAAVARDIPIGPKKPAKTLSRQVGNVGMKRD